MDARNGHRQQQHQEQQVQSHEQQQHQSNPQLLTPQSGTAQQQMRNDYPTPVSPRPPHQPSHRTFPSTELTNENLDENYVHFILCCNPAIGDDADTMELRQGLRSPPRSDGKTYSPFVIFRLIARLEAKDIKSWTALVVEMGVELPDVNKNQSTQKVQQYAVRLKRWLHAYHIDAFFHYCLGIPNAYYNDIPSPTTPLGENPRDGVLPEDDLALRALCPEWRPKRGRRRVDDEAEFENLQNVRQRQSLRQLKSIEPQRASSANITASKSLGGHVTPAQSAPWTAIRPSSDPWSAAHTAIAPRTTTTDYTPTNNPGTFFSGAQTSQQASPYQIRWRSDRVGSPSMQSNMGPNSGVLATPQTTQPSTQSFPTDFTQTSPPTPITGKRKRQSSTVSSAWQGGRDGASGKIRGRPPRDRSVVDGQFSTFPANPEQKKGNGLQNSSSDTIDVDTTMQEQRRPPSRHDQEAPATAPKSSAMNTAPKSWMQISGVTASGRKPSRLQLQVPAHEGGPVTLAETPQVLINGEATPEVETMHRDSAVSFPEDEDQEHDDEDHEDGDFDEGCSPEEAPTEVEENGDMRTDMIRPKTPEEARKWKRKAKILEKKLREKEDELKVMKRRVLDAVM